MKLNFISDCGYFSINLDKITDIKKLPQDDYSLLFFFDDSGIPCFKLKHRTEKQMEATFENLISIKKGEGAKILDLNLYKTRRKK